MGIIATTLTKGKAANTATTTTTTTTLVEAVQVEVGKDNTIP